MAGKWLELLKEMAPRVARVAFLFNPVTAPHFEYFLNPFKAAARSFAVEGIAAPVRDPSAFKAVVAAQAGEPNGGLIVMPDAFTTSHGAEITSLAARHGLPAVYPYREFTELGGLMSYGSDRLDNFRRAATYADRILKGTKPSELPVQAPIKFELVINLKTAKALGLDVPVTLSAARRRSDRIGRLFAALLMSSVWPLASTCGNVPLRSRLGQSGRQHGQIKEARLSDPRSARSRASAAAADATAATARRRSPRRRPTAAAARRTCAGC